MPFADTPADQAGTRREDQCARSREGVAVHRYGSDRCEQQDGAERRPCKPRVDATAMRIFCGGRLPHRFELTPPFGLSHLIGLLADMIGADGARLERSVARLAASERGAA